MNGRSEEQKQMLREHLQENNAGPSRHLDNRRAKDSLHCTMSSFHSSGPTLRIVTPSVGGFIAIVRSLEQCRHQTLHEKRGVARAAVP